MKIDTAIIRKFLEEMDTVGTKGDEEFDTTIDLIILELERKQKKSDNSKEKRLIR